MQFAIACVVVITGCLPVAEITCDDGTVCAVGRVCVPNGCALPEQLAACAGMPDGAECRFDSLVGRCASGVCYGQLCGNGKLDPGEVCDDGDRGSCSADCKRMIACGDGFVDGTERCDDQNVNPADGCDECALTTWLATTMTGGATDALAIGLSYPSGMAVDRYGALYVADTYHHRVLRVDPAGAVTTIAGTGVEGFVGDGGPANSARLRYPRGVAADALGNVYIGDTENHRVRQIDAAGRIMTIAGGGSGADGALATDARLSSPYSVVVDGPGNLFIADMTDQRIRRVDTTGVITTVAGIAATAGYNGDNRPATTAKLYSPTAIALDGFGSLYITDTANHRLRKVDSAGTITTVAGTGNQGFSCAGGSASSVDINGPIGVAVDPLGNIFFNDSSSFCVRRLTAGVLTTIAGTGMQAFGGDGGPATSASLIWPTGIAMGVDGSIYIADTQNYRIRHVDTAGVITTVVGSGSQNLGGDGGAATGAQLSGPSSAVFDSVGNMYVGEIDGNRIRRVDPSGVITTFAGTGVAAFGGDGGPATSAQLARPFGIALDQNGNLYVADSGNHRVRRIDATGVITTFAGTGDPGLAGDDGPATSAQLNSPYGVAIDAQGRVYIADAFNHRVRRVDPAGVITTVAGTFEGFGGDNGPATQALLDTPWDIALDAAGNLLIADTENNRVRRVDVAGTITTVAGTGAYAFSGDGGPATSAALAWPSGVATDSLGTIYIADAVNARIRRVSTTSAITTLAGPGLTNPGNFNRDGGPATEAGLGSPLAIAFDTGGQLHVVDVGGTVRRISATGVITTVAGLVDPPGTGPLAHAQLADPRALLVAAPFTFIAGGSSGTVEAIRGQGSLEAVAGRYPQPDPTGNLARFRDRSFGTIAGIAYDAGAGRLYLTESSANRLHVVTIVDPADARTWTIASLANASGTPGFQDGSAAVARFRNPSGLYLDTTARVLYIADTGNHVLRALDLTTNLVSTVAGTPQLLGFHGDGGAAAQGLLYLPRAVTGCSNGDLLIADTGNNRVRRVAAATGVITTVLGVGTAASSGDGTPARNFPVDTPLGVACDPFGNVFVSSRTTLRMLTADDTHAVGDSSSVITVYGDVGNATFPASATHCLTGVSVIDAETLEIGDSCTGLLVHLHRQAKP